MNLILAVDPVTPKLSGIGRYTVELARGLIALLATQLNSTEAASLHYKLRFFWHWKYVESIEALMEPSVVSNIAKNPDLLVHRLLRAVYEATMPIIQTALLRTNYDAIYHSPNFYLPKFPGKSISTFHDLSVTRFPHWHPAARISHLARALPLSLERADAIITPTECVRNELIADFDVNPRSVYVVPMGVSEEWFAPWELGDSDKLAALGLRQGEYALCVATLEPRKNITRLLEAYSGLSAPVRNRWPLVLCGQAGWLGDAIVSAISKATEQGWLHYLGFVPDPSLRALTRGARCFVFPSLYEGFGLPVLEAMACGTPVVASDIASLREVSADSGLYPCPTDVDAIRRAIEQALCDENWRISSSAKGLARAKRFSWARTVSETISVYQNVAEWA